MRRLGLLLAIVLAPATAWAQSPPAAPDDNLTAPQAAAEAATATRRGALVLAGPVNPATYVLGPGDLLALQLYGGVTRVITIEVGPEGSVILPDAGMLKVGGLTLQEARTRMLEQLRHEFRAVRVDIQLMRPRTFLVYRTGAVLQPGPAEAQGGARVADVLTREQLAPGASRRNIELIHRDGSREGADLDRLFRTGDAGGNPALADGDIVHVPVARDFVDVEGAVASPGRIERAPKDSLATLLRLAGGTLPSTAASGVLWMHWENATQADSIRLSLADLLDGSGDRPVSTGDRLYVYFEPNFRLQQQVSIVGEVARPGTYPVREGSTRISQILGAAGGFLPTADLSAVRVRHAREHADEKDPEMDRMLRLSRSELTASEYEVLRTKLANLREDYRIDWSMMTRNPGALDVLLRDGDMLFVNRLISTVRVDGEVQRPAILTFRPGLSVEDCVKQAGGFTTRAWRGKVRVTRAVTGQTLLARNIRTLGPGDFVWVPEKPDVTVWQQARDVLSAVTSVATIIIAIRSLR